MNCKLSWFLFSLVSILAIAMAYKFIVVGQTETSTDGRTAIILTESEKHFVMAEMRAFLEAVHKISVGVETSDAQITADAARKVGTADMQKVPGTLMGKLPLAFKKMGRATHQAFDQLALDAEQLGDEQHTLSQLNKILPNCIACHSIYRFEVK